MLVMKKPPPPKTKSADRAKKVQYSNFNLSNSVANTVLLVFQTMPLNLFQIAESFSNQYEEDFNNIVWTPPTGQTGDGRTSLNDKFGY